MHFPSRNSASSSIRLPFVAEATTNDILTTTRKQEVHLSGGSGRNQNERSLGRRRVTPVVMPLLGDRNDYTTLTRYRDSIAHSAVGDSAFFSMP